MAFSPRNDPALRIEKLGERYKVTRTSLKKRSVGAPIQAPLDALAGAPPSRHIRIDTEPT
jgi:hypothetical protein